MSDPTDPMKSPMTGDDERRVTAVRVPTTDPDRWPPGPPETVLVDSPEAASHWDERVWSSGSPS